MDPKSSTPSKTKWTPGPWAVTGGDGTPCVSDPFGLDVGWPSRRKGYPALANAHLIAAAPELYEALELALPIIEELDTCRDDEDDPIPLVAQIRSALAKARGEQS